MIDTLGIEERQNLRTITEKVIILNHEMHTLEHWFKFYVKITSTLLLGILIKLLTL